MIKIRITTEDGQIRYMGEDYPYNQKSLRSFEKFEDGLSYRNIMDFQIAWTKLKLKNKYPFEGSWLSFRLCQDLP